MFNMKRYIVIQTYVLCSFQNSHKLITAYAVYMPHCSDHPKIGNIIS